MADWVPPNVFDGGRLNGYLDEFLIYTRILSNTEINCLADRCDGILPECFQQSDIIGERKQCTSITLAQEKTLNLKANENPINDAVSPVS